MHVMSNVSTWLHLIDDINAKEVIKLTKGLCIRILILQIYIIAK